MKIDTDLLIHDARELAVLLDWREDSAGWGLSKMFNWALSRCPDDAPPSANDVIHGPAAAKLIASAAGWRRDPEAFISACEQMPHAPVERAEGGIRVCGLDRYDAAWGKSHPEEWKKWKAARDGAAPEEEPTSAEPVAKAEPTRAEAAPESAPISSELERTRNGTGPEPAPTRNGTGAEPAPQTQTQTQIQMQNKEEEDSQPPPVKTSAPLPTATPAARNGTPVVLEPPTSPPESWLGEDFWRWAQCRRQAGGLPAERRRPRDLGSWYSTALMTPGVDAHVLKEAWYAFGDDEFWAAKDPPYPFNAFLSQWDKYAAKEIARAAS